MFQKEVVYIIDKHKNGREILEVLKNIFFDWKIKEIFWNEKNNIFINNNESKDTFELFILESDLVINLLDRKIDKFKEVEEKLEIMKINRISNSLENIFLFSSKINIKKILKNKKIKTPVFEKIENKSAVEIFSNFPQPCRVFSKKNDFFSSQLKNSSDIEFALHKIKLDYGDVYNFIVEEYIPGQDIYALIKKDIEGNLVAYQVEQLNNGELIFLNFEQNEMINREVKEIFQKLNLDKFALLHFKFSKIRGLYLLNIFVDLDIYIGKNGEIINQIFENYGLKKINFLVY